MFPPIRPLEPSATLLYDCFPGLLSQDAPSQNQSAPPYVGAWKKFTGTDPKTGFAAPTGSPLFAGGWGTVVKGFGVYVISGNPAFPYTDPDPPDADDFAVRIGIGTEDIRYRGIDMTALTINQYNHINDSYDANTQFHFMLHRYKHSVGYADLTDCCIQTVIKVPDIDASLSTTYRYRTIHDFKTDSDFRYTVNIIKANADDATEFGVAEGTLGWVVWVDNDANGGLTKAEFIRMKNFTVPVPQGQYFGSDVCWKRGANYADTTAPRFRHIIHTEDRGTEVVFDINAQSVAEWNIDHPLSCTGNFGGVATDCVNRGMGDNGGAMERLFCASGYHGGIAGVDVRLGLARSSVWDGLPYSI